MTVPLTLTTVACPRCHTLLYRSGELGMVELHTGHQHDAMTCARRAALRLATESPWADIDT